MVDSVALGSLNAVSYFEKIADVGLLLVLSPIRKFFVKAVSKSGRMFHTFRHACTLLYSLQVFHLCISMACIPAIQASLASIASSFRLLSASFTL